MGSVSKPKVICIGLGRTGTMSLAKALEDLGLGPCYHSLQGDGAGEYKDWYNIGQGIATQDDIKNLLKNYNSFTDYPVAINFEKMYAAYPDAKFILTTRDPAKWEASMKSTILEIPRAFNAADPDSLPGWACKWVVVEMMARYHQGKLLTDAQGEILAHNQRVIDTIPADQLLVYEVTQGWDPLVKFLGVEKPDAPFPYANDKLKFQQLVTGFKETHLKEEHLETTSPAVATST